MQIPATPNRDEPLHSIERPKECDVRKVRIDRGDVCAYISFEDEDPQSNLARLAQTVHAKSYLGEGFVSDEAIQTDGRLSGDIDKLRGPGVVYYVGYDLVDGDWRPCSTLRKKRVLAGNSLMDLPGYAQCVSQLFDDGRIYLESAPLEDVREIGSFGHIPEVSSRVGLELLRHTLQDSFGKGEIWFFTMVADNMARLVKHFGPLAVRRVGEMSKIDDPRVNDVHLVPTVVDVDSFFVNVLSSIRVETSKVRRRHYALSALQFADGLSVDQLGAEVFGELQRLGQEYASPSSTPNMSLAEVTTADVTDRFIVGEDADGNNGVSEDWRPPARFDLNNGADRLLIKALVESGAVRRILRPGIDSIDALPTLRELDEGRDGDDRLALGDRYGEWFFFPWRETLVQMPPKEDYQALRTSRNRMLITAEEQEALLQPEILIAGMSTGSNVLEQLLHAGIGGAYTLADFDRLDPTNLNRIHSSIFDLGKPKVLTWGQRVAEVDPYVRVTLLQDGVTRDALDALDEAPRVIFDQVDDFTAKALLREYARKHRVPVVMVSDTASSALIDVERYDTESPSPFNGRLRPKVVEKMLAGGLTDAEKMRITTSLIGLTNASFRLLQSVVHRDQLGGFPQRGSTASVGAAAAAEIVQDVILGRPVHSGRRKVPIRGILNLSPEDGVAERLRIAKTYAEMALRQRAKS